MIRKLDCINTRLRITASIEAILRLLIRSLVLQKITQRDIGDYSGNWIETHHSGLILFHVEQTTGSRQEMCMEGAGDIY